MNKFNSYEKQGLEQQFAEELKMVFSQFQYMDHSNFVMLREFVEDEDYKVYNKNLMTITKYSGLSLIGGLILNRFLTTSRFFPKNIFIRLPIRLGLLLIPNIPFIPLYKEKMEKSNQILYKYNLRINKFRKTMNLKYYDPQGKILEKKL